MGDSLTPPPPPQSAGALESADRKLERLLVVRVFAAQQAGVGEAQAPQGQDPAQLHPPGHPKARSSRKRGSIEMTLTALARNSLFPPMSQACMAGNCMWLIIALIKTTSQPPSHPSRTLHPSGMAAFIPELPMPFPGTQTRSRGRKRRDGHKRARLRPSGPDGHSRRRTRIPPAPRLQQTR